MSDKDILAEKAIAEIPRILGLIDKNKLSPTYGCFDRNFWHYNTVDFPTGMAQLGVLPLAYVYSYKFPNNLYYKKERVKELAIAGISYLEKCSHRDGTTDEFYPFERALGATAFSLIACTEAHLILGLDNKRFVNFFKKRADWMLKNTEPGIIANHQAGAAVALANVYLITKDTRYLKGAKEKIKNALSWFNEEGWAYEYEGADPGYATFTIDFLAKYYKKTKDKSVLPVVKKSVEFCSYFMAPDGSYGGEYGSRNTSHFVPHGFEAIGKDAPLAFHLVDQFLVGLKNGKNEFMNDDKYFFYDVINYFQAYLDFNEKRPKIKNIKNKDFTKYFSKAKIWVAKKGRYYTVISLAKGGVMKVFKDKELIYNDCGFIAKTSKGSVVTTQVISGNKIDVKGDILSVSGRFNNVKFRRPTPFSMVIFRTFLLLVAWNWKIGNITKHILTKLLITGRKKEPFYFERKFNVSNKGVEINSEIKLLSKQRIRELYIGSDLAVIKVPTSNYFKQSILEQWISLNDKLEKLNTEKEITLKQKIE